ncbi:DNA replication licensing factor mcm9, partial [Globisporangium splendens]
MDGDANQDGGDLGVANVNAATFEARAKEYQSAFRSFLDAYYQSDVAQLQRSLLGGSATATTAALATAQQSDAQQQSFAFSLRICAQVLLDFNPSLGTLLFRHPDQFLPLFHAALAQQVTATAMVLPSASRRLSSELAGPQGFATVPLKVQQRLKVRIEFLPPVNPLRKSTISTIRSNDVKQLIQIAGTVVRTGMKVCPSEGSKPCKSTQFDIVESSRVVSDHQVIKIQEQVSRLGVGSIPRSILVVLEDDLVDSVKAGDHVVVVGILMRCWRPCIKDIRCDLETIVKANSIRIKNATSAHVLVTEELKKEFAHFWQVTHARDPMRGRNEIIASICPKVYGLFIVKLGVALTVIGGCSHANETGMKTRGEPHMLLIGDPGTGKSQFLRFTAELSPRSVLTTGIGTTSAGLTCTAVKDGGEWMLEAGALVLADRGVCCIDEFSSIRSNDRTSIHEAMEQQTLSVAKAGLVCKLNARTTVFAVTNPKGRYDPNADVSVNTAIGSPLLSRFDLILVLLDRMNANWDEVVSSFILQQSTGQGGDHVKQEAAARDRADDDNDKKNSKDDLLWSIPKLQAYICYVKDKYQPQLSRSAMTILQRYYQLQRSSDTRSAARTTIRLLESLTRLAQAHARLMCHEDVQVMDAVVAVFVMEVSKATDNCSTMLEGGLESVLHSDFADDPTAEYALQEKMVLEHLGLTEFATCRSSSQYSQVSRSQQYRQSQRSQRMEEKEECQPFVALSMEESRPQAHARRDFAPPPKRWQPRTEQDHSFQAAVKRHRGEEMPPSPSQQQQSTTTWSQRLSGLTRPRGENNDDDDAGGSQRSRFSFGKWSQQQNSSQSVTSRWRK